MMMMYKKRKMMMTAKLPTIRKSVSSSVTGGRSNTALRKYNAADEKFKEMQTQIDVAPTRGYMRD